MTTAAPLVESPDYIGTLRETRHGYFAQFSIGAGERKGTILRTCTDEKSAKRRQLAIAALVARLRDAGLNAIVKNTIRDAGRLDNDGFRKLERLVGRIIAGKEPGLARRHGARREGMTIEELSELWTSGKLHAEFPDHVKLKKTSSDDKRQLGWFAKTRMPDGTLFGSRAVATVTLDDCDHVMAALPKPPSRARAAAPTRSRFGSYSPTACIRCASYPRCRSQRAGFRACMSTRRGLGSTRPRISQLCGARTSRS